MVEVGPMLGFFGKWGLRLHTCEGAFGNGHYVIGRGRGEIDGQRTKRLAKFGK